MDGDSISEDIICEKAQRIYADLVEETDSTSAEGEKWFTFEASRGLIGKFKHRSGIHDVARNGEAVSSSKEAAEKHVGEFRDLVNAGGYRPQQVSNCDETGLFWKKMPNMTYITKVEKYMPGHKSMKDMIIILICANASDDCKIKPMVIYHSEDTRILKRNKFVEEQIACYVAIY